MREPDAAELIYFTGEEDLLPAYLKLREELLRLFPDSVVWAQKSQISFRCPRPYCWVWTLAGHGARKPGGRPMFVTFASPFAIESPLIHTVVEPYPGRFTHHVQVSRLEDITEELLTLIQASHAFRNKKK